MHGSVVGLAAITLTGTDYPAHALDMRMHAYVRTLTVRYGTKYSTYDDEYMHMTMPGQVLKCSLEIQSESNLQALSETTSRSFGEN